VTLLISSFGVSLVLVGLLLPLLRRAQLLDVPNHRSSHSAPTPRGAGVGVVAAIAATLLLVEDFTAWPVVLAAGVMAGVGLVDDVRSLSGATRLLAQVLVAAGVGAWLLTGEEQTWWVVVAAVFVLIGYVNAFNFMDGINGISGLTALVIGAYWATQGAPQGLDAVRDLGLVTAGAALGFLPWNAPRARVFLGDAGSYGIGLLVASLSVLAWVRGAHWFVALAPLVVYGADTGWVLVKRVKGRRPLMEAHREHVYQRLVDGGWSHVTSAGFCGGTTALVCLCAALTWSSVPVVGLAATAGIVLAYLSAPRLALGRGVRTA